MTGDVGRSVLTGGYAKKPARSKTSIHAASLTLDVGESSRVQAKAMSSGGDNQPSSAQLAALTRLAHTVTIGAALNLLGVPDNVLCAAIDQGQWPVL